MQIYRYNGRNRYRESSHMRREWSTASFRRMPESILTYLTSNYLRRKWNVSNPLRREWSVFYGFPDAKSLLFQLFIFIISSVYATPTLIDSFEGKLEWKTDQSGDFAYLSVIGQNATDSKHSLLVSFQDTGNGKSIISHPGFLDLSQFNALVLDITNPQSTPLEVAIALQTGAGWTWFESKPVSAKPGLNKGLRFDLTKKSFKSAASHWQYTTTIENPNQLQQIDILIFPGQLKKVDVYLDNIRLEKTAGNVKQTQTALDVINKPKKNISSIPLSKYVAPKIISVSVRNSKIDKYAKFEAIIKFSGTYQYPFDPEDIRIDANVTSPSGKQFTIPGYLHDRDKWLIRFSPNETGNWTYTIKVTNPKGSDTSEEHKFACVPSTQKGPIHVDQSDWHYFSYDNGEFYYPIGENVAWLPSPETNYPIYFSKMGKAKANWARVWMSRWGALSIEEKEGEYGGLGLGHYSLENAERLDHILDSAEQNGVYVQLVLNYHGQFSSTVNPNWNDNPYNVKQGGFLKSGGEVFTNDSAKRLFKNRYRYIVARWGYHPAIMGWELWNEVSQTDDYEKQKNIVGDWHQEMAAYIHSIDFSKHPITTSYCDEAREKPDINYTQIHCYNKDYVSSVALLDDGYYKFNKPVFFGEIGDPDGLSKDTEGIAIHQWMWASVAQPQGGSAMGWTWNNYVDPYNLYGVFTPIADFTKELDRAKCKLDQDAKISIYSSSTNYSDVSFGPVLGWGPSTESTFDVGQDGSVTHLKGLSSYFQGSFQPQMRVEPVFNLHCPNDGEFIVNVGQISGWGAAIEIYLDGKFMAQKEFPGNPQKQNYKINSSLTIPLSTGTHQVKVVSSKDDWFIVNKIIITNYGLSAKAIGVSSPQAAVLWVTNPVYNTDNYYQGIHPELVKGIYLDLWGLSDGKYQVEFWDTYKGRLTSVSPGKSENGKLTIAVPPFDKDLAIKILPQF